MTRIHCPYCGAHEDHEIHADVFDYYHRDEHGRDRKIKSKGMMTCPECKREFMYRYAQIVIAQTAQLNWMPGITLSDTEVEK